jgi:sulfur-oxidizing protein SoxX
MDNATYDNLTAALILRNIHWAAQIARGAAANKDPVPLRQLRSAMTPWIRKPLARLTICRRRCSVRDLVRGSSMRPGRKAAAAISAGFVLCVALCAVARAQTLAMPGQTLAFDRAKGNCLTCHDIKGGDAPGNVGPQLADMKKRFPDRNELAAVIFDETKRNPQSVMPPFGRNLILTHDEIESIVDFLYTR